MNRLPASGPLALAACAVLVGGLAPGDARADLARAADHFAAGAWDKARVEATRDDAGARPAESQLWRSRLAADPEAALALLREGLDQRRLPQPVRARLALEVAEIELGRGRPGESLKVLVPLLEDADELPGAVPVAAARALVALGRAVRARELLVSVRPDDADHGLSRALLGDIALAAGDADGALSWYDAAERADDRLRRRLATGRCRALLKAGRAREAEALAARLEVLDPDGLALLEVRRALAAGVPAAARRAPAATDTSTPRGEEAAVPRAEAPTPPAETAGREAPGRYALQLGAFGDHDRALELRRRLAGQVPGLALEEGVDAQGRTVWRARAGGWDERAAADDAARDLARRLGLDVRVIDRRADLRPGT